MRPVFRKAIVSLLIALTAPVYSATEIARGYTCNANASPEKIITSFIQHNVIQSTPFDNTDAILSFEATATHTAFGFPLVAITAWEDGTKLFGRLPGTAPSVHFSIIVQGNPWEIRNVLRKSGIKLSVRSPGEGFPQVMIDGFNSDYPETLPQKANSKLAYTKITCNPRA